MTELDLLRIKITEIDKEMINILKKRIEISKKIGEFKKNNNLPIFDPKRESEIIELFTKDEKLENKIFIEKFLQLLMDISKEVQLKWENLGF